MSASQSSKGAELDARTLEQLMAYLDGELAGPELAAIETLIAENPDAARVVGELDVLGECIRVAEPHSAAGFDVADAVMAKIAAPAAAEAPARPASNPPRVAPVVDLASRRRRTLGVVAALVAAAAAVVVVARQSADAPTGTAPVAQAPTAQAPAPSATVTTPAPVATALASNEPPKADGTSDVGNVSVIVVPSDEEKTAPSVVIWLGGEEGSGGGIK